MILKLRSLLEKEDKQFLVGLILFSIFISIIEMVGISAIMPFIAMATDFTLIHSNSYYQAVYQFFDFDKEVSFVITFGMVLIVFYLFRSSINLLYFYLLNRFTQGRYHLLANRLFKNYMEMPYETFIAKNSSSLNKSIITEASNLTHLLSAILFMLSEIFVVILLYGMMLYVHYQITLLLSVILVFNALLMVKTVSVKIKKAGKDRAEAQKSFYEIINRSFANFKLIKLQKNRQEIFEDFGTFSASYAKANIVNSTLVQVPRLFLEAIGFGLIVLIVTYLVWKYENNISTVLALVSMFVLALYRLMPSVNRIMNSYNQILFYHKSLEIVDNDLKYEREVLGDKEIVFKHEIKVENIGFEYEENHPILKDINLSINKGAKVAFVGESGSGKSTLVDLLIGLNKAKTGSILIDGERLSEDNMPSWRSKIGYIPQSVYLFDGTVGENVAFGLHYDAERIAKVLKQAKIDQFLAEKKGAETFVGEGGVMLSGGQKQRIAIARALYMNPEVLVLDEATSALDDETEQEIMNEIYMISKDKTLIIIAHRLSTIDRCDRVYKVDKGYLVA
ncbi:MAG: Phospholipid-lipopolysaccharide ABC transporter [uncultured Sulfurovum sp.]|uniref:Phospholipid-lipopolysaccharide ABC transporter n=1 Tax=uncultured Sulfurovum sp. TaxID=269237 RepID=A0A6S6SGH0_9BACT|nr:MAG: Phospholipid-lipopolysaccharide ABC transporter [uncultured Sulfurovum sp.]